MTINPDHFPHIDLDEPSVRPGVDGPRYVEVPNMPGCLGDTNTGLTVYPQRDRVVVSSYSDVKTQLQDQLSIIDG